MLRTKAKPTFGSIPNFRVVTSESEGIPLLYRSSRPDFITDLEVTSFRNLGVRSIIDFRSPKEYQKADGSKLLDQHYEVQEVKFVKKGFAKVPPGELHPVVPVKVTKSDEFRKQNVIGKHYLVNFFQLNYVWAKFNQAPLWFRLCSLLYLLYDFVFNTGYVNFVRAYAKQVLNKEGLLGQYIDMINLSQEPIRAGRTT